MYDRLIAGRVVTPGGIVDDGWVAVTGETIAAVGAGARPPAAQVAHRVPERAKQEARIRERDHEPVVPAQRLQELPFLDHRFCHITLP